MVRTRVTHEMREKARALRNYATKAEGLLWSELRDFRNEGIKFRRQSPIGPYIVDFVCLAARLVVEIDGDFHEAENRRRHDANRDAYLRSLGFTVLRIDEPDVIANYWAAAQEVKQEAARFIGDPTRPLRGHPPLKGEGTRAAAGATRRANPTAWARSSEAEG